jgi:hypothetical protein
MNQSQLLSRRASERSFLVSELCLMLSSFSSLKCIRWKRLRLNRPPRTHAVMNIRLKHVTVEGGDHCRSQQIAMVIDEISEKPRGFGMARETLVPRAWLLAPACKDRIRSERYSTD